MFDLKYLDLFQVSPALYVNKQEKYQTKFGGFLSVTLFIILGVSLWVYGRDIYLKENPNITYVEISTDHPKRYNLTEDNFNLV